MTPSATMPASRDASLDAKITKPSMPLEQRDGEIGYPVFHEMVVLLRRHSVRSSNASLLRHRVRHALPRKAVTPPPSPDPPPGIYNTRCFSLLGAACNGTLAATGHMRGRLHLRQNVFPRDECSKCAGSINWTVRSRAASVGLVAHRSGSAACDCDEPRRTPLSRLVAGRRAAFCRLGLGDRGPGFERDGGPPPAPECTANPDFCPLIPNAFAHSGVCWVPDGQVSADARRKTATITTGQPTIPSTSVTAAPAAPHVTLDPTAWLHAPASRQDFTCPEGCGTDCDAPMRCCRIPAATEVCGRLRQRGNGVVDNTPPLSPPAAPFHSPSVNLYRKLGGLVDTTAGPWPSYSGNRRNHSSLRFASPLSAPVCANGNPNSILYRSRGRAYVGPLAWTGDRFGRV